MYVVNTCCRAASGIKHSDDIIRTLIGLVLLQYATDCPNRRTTLHDTEHTIVGRRRGVVESVFQSDNQSVARNGVISCLIPFISSFFLIPLVFVCVRNTHPKCDVDDDLMKPVMITADFNK